ncbi:MAG TPA: diguanylate cyclase, partial [Thermoanaerobaculia bacterium]|nr:diguanylate cyclase [Thermoanaerobaculia bacterium]
MQRRLLGALLAILIFFFLNIGVRFWGERSRAESLAELQNAVERQLLINGIGRHLGDARREVALLAGGFLSEQGPVTDEAREAFAARLRRIHSGIAQVRAIPGSSTPLADRVAADARELTASWARAYESFGVDSGRAIAELSLRSDPLSRQVSELLPRWELEERRRVARASQELQRVSELTDRVAVLFFVLSTLVMTLVAIHVSHFLVDSNRRLEERVHERTRALEQEVQERRKAEDQLFHDAFHDPLTDLANRALFLDRLGLSLVRAKRRPAYHFAVLFFDLDRFKLINDSLGHLSGDQTLVTVARRLEACVRPGDTVARLGGDEFAILLDDIRDLSDVDRLTEQVEERLAAPIQLGGNEIFISSSIGIAFGKAAYERPEEILRDADAAMYRAKALGRARHEVFSEELHLAALDRLRLETDLRRAVQEQSFRVQYQPIISLPDGRLTGFEALVRWWHPAWG